jgi:DNA-binding transcriptional MerR regulator
MSNACVKNLMNAFTIKDLENLTGIKAHTIRIWEQRYSFLKPKRTNTNIRFYSNEELKKILNISLLNKYGYKISHIDRMTEPEINEKIIGLNNSLAQQERIINDLIQRMVDMDTESFEASITDYIRNKGIEKAINQIIFPFLERIGVLWMTGHINPAQEHLVSNIIRQKIIVGIDSVGSHLVVDKTVLCFLPEGEFHELGLLYIHYLLKSRGVKVLYVGSNIPMDDVQYVIREKKPDYLYTHLTSVSNGFNFDRFMAQALRRFEGVPFVVSGLFAQQYEKILPGQVMLKKSLQEVSEFIASLGNDV